MKKTLSKNKILVTFLAFLTVLTALFGVLTMPKSVSAEEQQTRGTDKTFVFPDADCFKEVSSIDEKNAQSIGGHYYRIYLTGGHTFAGMGDFWVLKFAEEGLAGVSAWGVLSDVNGLMFPSNIGDYAYFVMRSSSVCDFYVVPGVVPAAMNSEHNTSTAKIYPGTFTKLVLLEQKSSGGNFVFPEEKNFEASPYILGTPLAGKYFRIKIASNSKENFEVLFNETYTSTKISFVNDLFRVPGAESELAHFVRRELQDGYIIFDVYFEEDFELVGITNGHSDGFTSFKNCYISELTLIDAPEETPEDNKDPGAIDGIKDWINGVAGDISSVIKNNVGFTISSSAILVIGGALVAYVIFKKKR